MNNKESKLSFDKVWLRKLIGAGVCCLLAAALFLTVSTGQANTEKTIPDWLPDHLEVGMSELPSPPPMFQVPDGTAYRQQYLSGGAGTGWSTWNNNGDFARLYIQKSIEKGKTPIFTYYMICQSGHGGGGNGGHPCYSQEQNTIRDNLANSGTMYGYWANVKLFYEKAAQFPNQTVIFHVEPDMWGHIHQMSANDNAGQYPHSVKVGGSGFGDLNGISDTPAGFADALYRLRDVTGAHNVKIAYHVSIWGTRTDISLSDPNPNELQQLAGRSVQFYQSLDQQFDLTFFEMRDRDAGFYEVQYGIPNAWWQSNDYDNHIAWIDRFTNDTGQAVMLWQLPYGNTKTSDLNNTWGFFKDNIVETLLDESDYRTLKRYADAGVVAIVFGQGAGGTTCPCDSNNDGRIDDGGFFKNVASRYANGNKIRLKESNDPLPGAPAPTSVPPTQTPVPPTPTPEPEVITLSPWVERFGEGIVIRWNEVDVDSYEIWWGDTSNLIPSNDCNGSESCTYPSGTGYMATLPDSVDSRYYILVTRKDGYVMEVSDVFQAVRLTEEVYLPVIAK